MSAPLQKCPSNSPFTLSSINISVISIHLNNIKNVEVWPSTCCNKNWKTPETI